MNPPYIKFQNLSIEYRNFIKQKWNILNTGNIDIYYAFIMKCLEIIPLESEVRQILYKNLFSQKSFNLINGIFEKIFISF